MSFKLPFGVEVLNPVPTDTRRGPYTAANETDAKALACAGVPAGVRGQGQQVDLIINGTSLVYVWANGIADTDLVPLETPMPQPLGTSDSPTFADITANSITVNGNTQTHLKKSNGSAGSGLLVETVANNVTSLLDLTVSSPGTTGAVAKKNYQIQQANLPDGHADVTFVQYLQDKSGTIALTNDIPAVPFKGIFTSLSALQSTYPTANNGDSALITGTPNDLEYYWDGDHAQWVQRGTSTTAPGFAAITGNPGDNAALSSALSGKQNTLTNSDSLSEGLSNLYFSTGRVLSTLLNGIGFSATSAILATDSILTGLGKLQAQINNFITNLTTGVTGILGVVNGGTGSSSFNVGRILFGNGTNALNNDAALFWDNTNKRLSIGADYAPLNPLSTINLQYSIGIASQSGGIVNGSGTTWTSTMVGQTLVFANGVSAGLITGVNSATQITVTTSQTVSSQSYNIIYPGLQVSATNNVGVGQLTPATWLSNTNSTPTDNEGMTTSPMGISWRVNTGDYDRFAMSLENYGSYGNGLLIKKNNAGHYALKVVNQSNGLEFYVGDGGKLYTASTIQSVGSWTMGADIGIFPISGFESMISSYHGLMLVGKKGSVSAISSIGNTSNVAIPIQDGSATGFLIRGATIQSGNLMEVQNSNGTILAKIDASSNAIFPQYRLSALNTAPASSTDTGTTGEIRITSNYIYVCVATNTWVRSALSTW
jgi:hypothetical protein